MQSYIQAHPHGQVKLCPPQPHGAPIPLFLHPRLSFTESETLSLKSWKIITTNSGNQFKDFVFLAFVFVCVCCNIVERKGYMHNGKIWLGPVQTC